MNNYDNLEQFKVQKMYLKMSEVRVLLFALRRVLLFAVQFCI
jgi:hypothetical protein